MIRSKKGLEVSVACASRMAARVECVIEALTSRGHKATLHIGASARDALLSADAGSLRVLLLAERLDAVQLATLEHGLDPDRLGNLLVTTIDRSAPDMAERIEAFARVVKRPRRTPAIVKIAEPTPMPAKRRKWAVPVGAAAIAVAGLCLALQYGLRRQPRAEEPEPAVAGALAAPVEHANDPSDASPSDPVELSVERPVPDEEIEIFDINRARHRRAKKAPEPAVTSPARVEPPPPTQGPIAEAPTLRSSIDSTHAPRGRDLPAPGEEQRLE